jgi:hypothetical protein
LAPPETDPLDLGDRILVLLHGMTLRGDNVKLRKEPAELVRQLAWEPET